MSNYNINHSEPTKDIFEIIPGGYNGPGGTESNSSLRLYGRGALEWGESVDEDLLRLCENYSSSTAPITATNGQLFRKTAIYWREGAGPYTWYKFDVNATSGTGTWSSITATVGAGGANGQNLPVPTLLVPIADGTYYYNTDNQKLYGYFSVFGQVASGWKECSYTSSTIAPVDGTDYPQQSYFVYNGFTAAQLPNGPELDANNWEPFNATVVDVNTPINISKGTLWWDDTNLSLYNGTSWTTIGGYTASQNYDMDGNNLINLPDQCSNIPDTLLNHSSHAASVGFVECYVAQEMAGAGDYVSRVIDTTMASGVDITFDGGEVFGLPNVPSANDAAASKKYVDDKLASVGFLPIGTMIELPYNTGTPIPGWMRADGRAMSAATYSDLFNALVTNSGFSVVAGVSCTLASPSIFTKASHGFKGGERIRFSSTNLATGLSSTVDYFVRYLSSSTFYLSLTPYGTRIGASSTGTNMSYLQSWWGLGSSTNISPPTSFNLPDMRGAFSRDLDTGELGSAGIDMGDSLQGRTLGTIQKASLLYGDNANNSVNTVDRVGDNRTALGWDPISVNDYTKGNTTDVVTTNAASKYGNGNTTNNHVGGGRPHNVATVYYIKAYDTDNAVQAEIDVGQIATDVATLQSQMPFVQNNTTPSVPYVNATSTFTLAHGLGNTPTLVFVYMQCVATDGGYSSGDRVMLSSYVHYDGNNRGITITYDATSVKVLVGGTSSNGIKLLKKSDNTRFSPADSCWTINVKAYL